MQFDASIFYHQPRLPVKKLTNSQIREAIKSIVRRVYH